MANNEDFLDLTGLSYFKGRLDRAFPSKEEFNALDEKVDEIISEGGEPNTIETISVNGTNVPPDANKNVDLDIPEEVFIAIQGTTSSADIKAAYDDNIPMFVLSDALEVVIYASYVSEKNQMMLRTIGSSGDDWGIKVYKVVNTNWTIVPPFIFASIADIPTDLSDLTNTGEDPYATESYVDENGGKIDSISVNGTPQTIDDHKNVDLDIPEGVFKATPNVTTYADLKAAYDDKTPIIVNRSPVIEMILDANENLHLYTYESTASGNFISDFMIDSTNDWLKRPFMNLVDRGELPTDLSDLTNTGSDPYAQMSDVESAVVGALKPKGSVAFADLPQLTAANLNSMYNVTDEFTTTIDFVEGAGKTYPAGTNVAIINVGTDQNPVYKYDCYTGVMDLSGYWDKTELTAITAAQIDSLFE